MKKMMYLAAAVTAIVLMSCGGNSVDQQLKKNIVGKFNHSTTRVEEGNTVILDTWSTFNADMTVVLEGSVSMEMNMAELAMLGVENPISMKFYIYMDGTYDIKDANLIYTYDKSSLKIDLEQNAAGEMGELFDNFIQPMLDMYIIPSLENELVQKPQEKIVEITDKHLILETGAVRTTYVRMN